MESSGRCSPGRVAPLRPARPAAAAACPPDPNCHAQHRAPRAEVEDGPADGAREARAAAHQQQARSGPVLRVLARDLRGRTGPRILRLLAPRQLVDRDLLRRQHALLCVFVQVPVQPVRTAPVSDLSLQLGGDDPPQGHWRASRCARRAVSKAPPRKTKEILSRTSLYPRVARFVAHRARGRSSSRRPQRQRELSAAALTRPRIGIYRAEARRIRLRAAP